MRSCGDGIESFGEPVHVDLAGTGESEECLVRAEDIKRLERTEKDKSPFAWRGG